MSLLDEYEEYKKNNQQGSLLQEYEQYKQQNQMNLVNSDFSFNMSKPIVSQIRNKVNSLTKEKQYSILNKIQESENIKIPNVKPGVSSSQQNNNISKVNIPINLANKEETKNAKKINDSNLFSQSGKVIENAWLGGINGVLNLEQSLGNEIGKNQINQLEMFEKQNNELINNRLKDNANKDQIIDTMKKNSIINSNDLKENRQNFIQKKQEQKQKKAQKTELNSTTIDNPTMKKLSEIAPSVGQMAPAFIPGIGSTYLAGSAKGSYYDDAIQRGMSEEEADKYSSVMALAEAGTEMIGIGNLSKAGKGVKSLAKREGIQGFKNVLKNTANEEMNQSVKTVLKDYGIGIADNVIQEAIIDPIQELAAQAIGGKDKANWDDIGQRMIQDGISGGLVSAILGAGNMGVQSCVGVTQKLQNNQKITTMELNKALTDAQNVGIDFKEKVKENVQNTLQNNTSEPIIEQQNLQNNVVNPLINKVTQNGNIEQIEPITPINIENKTNVGYNNIESEGGIDGTIQGLERLPGQLYSSIFKEETQKQNREYTKREFEQWESTVKQIRREEITAEQKLKIDNVKRQYNKDIVFFDSQDNDSYLSGASLNDKNKIYIDTKAVKEFGENKVIHHEIMESNIRHNRSISNDFVQPAIEKIIEDPNFQKQKAEFWDEQDGDMPSDFAIAKEILCDRFAEIKTGEKWDYKNLLSQETNMTIDYSLENFENALYNQNNQKLPIPPMTEEVRKQIQENQAPIFQRDDNLPDTMKFIANKRTKDNATLKEIKDTLAQIIVNKGHYIDKLAKETGNEKLTWLYDRTMNTFNEAQISIGERQINSNGQEVGKSLLEIFKPSQELKLEKEFEDYLLNKHNISRKAFEKGIFGDEISANESKKIVQKYEKQYPQFKLWSEEVSKYNDNNLRDLVDNGLVSESIYKNLKSMYGDYVPTYRDITQTMAEYEQNKIGSNPLKHATQNDLNILSVKENMAEQTLAIKKAIRMNNIGVELYKTLGKDSKIYDGIPIDANTIALIGGDVIQNAGKGNNTFAIFQNGEITYFKISDEIFSAFNKDNLQNKINHNKVARTILLPVEKLSKAQRNLLTTYSIGFAFNNPIKDFQDSLFNTKYDTGSFFKNYSKALYNIAKNGDWYKSYKNNGGTANTYFDYEKGILPTSTKNPVKKIADKIKYLNEILEQAPRLAEYISTIEHNGTIDEALYNSADITTNFKRGGDTTKVANKYGANFLNASIQGLDKLYRNLAGQRGWKGYANIITKAVLFQVTPAIINGLLLGDDEDYNNLPEYDKDNYFLFKKSNGEIARIAKGRVSSVVGGIARRVLETSQGKEADWKSLIDTTINQLAPNNPFSDNLIAPINQAISNKAWYGGNIVNTRLQKLPEAEQYDETTDSVSKLIGEKTNISPKKINYILKQYSGGIGKLILPTLTPQAENNVLEDLFIIDPTMKNKHVSEYYDKLEELEKKKNSTKATDEDILQYKYMGTASNKLSELYNKKREIQNSKLKNSEKKQEVREIQKEINNIVKRKLDNFKDINKKDGVAKVDYTYFRINKKNTWEKMDENEVKNYKKALQLGLTNKSYQTYKNNISPIEGKKDNQGKTIGGSTNGQKALAIMKTDYSNNEKNAMLKLLSQTAKNPETVETLSRLTKTEKAYTEYFSLNKSDTFFQTKISRDDMQDIIDLKINQNEFNKFAQDIGKIQGKKDKNGKTISGSKKQAVAQYVNSLKLTSGEKAILFAKAGYPEKQYKQAIYNHINGLKLTAKRKKEIWDSLGYK